MPGFTRRMSLAVLAAVVLHPAGAAAQPPVALPTLPPGQGQPSGAAASAAQPAAVPAAPQPIAPPWAQQLTSHDLQQLDLVLQRWQQTSGQVKTFSAEFDLWEYNAVFPHPKNPQAPTAHSLGMIRYAQPDKGYYRITDTYNVADWPQEPPPAPVKDGEYWMCDGQAVYEFNHPKKQLIEHRLPPELQGKAISDGPLPFVFGVEAQKMKSRYWLRIVTPPELKGREIRLEACPKFREDAANFRQVDIILTEPNLTPYAVQVHEPNGKVRKVYSFNPQSIKINAALDRIAEFWKLFVRPTPLPGYQYVVDNPQPSGQVPPPAPAPPQGPLPATRPLLPLR